MKKATSLTLAALALCMTIAGCAPRAAGPKKEARPQAAPAAPVPAAPVEIPPTVVVTPGQLTVEEVRARREMERELDRDNAAYMKLLSERNVEDALKLVIPEGRAKAQTDLWRFLADYSFDSWEIISKKVEYVSGSPNAVIQAVVVVYQKNVVAPQKLPLETKWSRVGDKWLLIP